jgi:hypothetical protein
MRLHIVFGKSRNCSTCWNTCSYYCHLTLPSSGHIFSCWQWSVSMIEMQGINFDFLYWGEVQIPGARSPWRPNFVRWHLIFVGPWYGCFVLLFLRLEFRIASRFLENCAPLFDCITFRAPILPPILDLGQNLPSFLTPGRSLWFRKLSHFLHLRTSLRLSQLYYI